MKKSKDRTIPSQMLANHQSSCFDVEVTRESNKSTNHMRHKCIGSNHTGTREPHLFRKDNIRKMQGSVGAHVQLKLP
jgi:hypothetical protein